MVGMLMAFDLAELFRAVVLQRGLARQVDDSTDPAEPRLGSVLQGRYHPVGAVERAGHDLDFGTADAPKTQRRAAVGAKIAHRNRRGAERLRLAASPCKVLARNVGE